VTCRVPEWMQSELEKLGLIRTGNTAHQAVLLPTRKATPFRNYEEDH